MKNILFVITFLILLTSCERNVTIEIPEKAPKLVVHGLLEKDKVIDIRVGKSRHILSGDLMNQLENYTVKDATVVVYEDNVIIDTLVYQPQDYRYKSMHNKMVRDGFTYAVKIRAPGFTDADATTVVPTQSTMNGLTLVKDARVNSYGEHMDEITLKFNDPAGERNYYMVQVYSAGYSGYEGQTVWCVSTTDKDIEAIGENTDPLSTDNCYDGGSLLLRDDNFNGTQKQLRFYVNSWYMEEHMDPSSNRTWRPYVKVLRISEDYFKYIKSYNVYYNASGNPFAEPVNVYSNIKNGYGTFSAYTVAVDTLRH